MVTAAPVIQSEMDDWVFLGGGNSGIVGDANHSYGFHCAAQDISPDDYSRWRDPNGSDGPYVDWNYACAGDFSHKNDANLRKMHADVLGRLMAGEMPMVCEFIGKPFADQPVLYWARWNGDQTLQQYTGSGHDTWSHISWYRSRVNERANLWLGGDMPSAEEIAQAVLNGVYHSADWPNPNNFSLGYMVFAINNWLSEPRLPDEMAAMREQLNAIQESINLLTGPVAGVPEHEHVPGGVKPPA